LQEAARLLRCATDDVRKLIAHGKLIAVPGARRPVYLLEVQALAATIDLPSRPPHPAPPSEGHVNTQEAAKILGRSISCTRQLAAGTSSSRPSLPERGSDQLEMVRRAWLIADAHGRGEAVEFRNPPRP
jgi:hypothetical protein